MGESKQSGAGYVAAKGFNYGKDDTRVDEGAAVAKGELPPAVEKELVKQGALKPAKRSQKGADA